MTPTGARAHALPLLFVLVACGGGGGGPTTPPGKDGGPDDMVDAQTADASGDADVSMDGSIPDSGDTDSGPVIVCDPGVACGASDTCDPGLRCVTNACGTKVCQPSGATCSGNDECAAGSTCTSTPDGSICVPSNGEICNASTDCPASHSCEGAPGSRSCVLRRLACADEADCPVSFVCVSVLGDSQACQYAYRPCDFESTCSLGVCSDIDADGDTECGGGGTCSVNTDCTTSGERCVFSAFNVSCGLGGLCNASGGDSCASGFDCMDLQGDGYGECVAMGGTCMAQSDCTAGGICAVPSPGMPPACITGM